MTGYIADLRQNYARAGLSEAEADTEPLPQFQRWLEAAIAAQVPEPNAMTLATATPEGRVTARIVLLKGLDERGLVFYTNYNSRKAAQLSANPYGALVFWWSELERQVRFEGPITPIAAAESDAYFQSRPLGSRLGAWASPQSQAIADRTVLEQRLQALEAKYAEGQVPRPPHWGGFRLQPETVEFWQGRPNRLHDRLAYTRQADGSWQRQRLAP
ncbi:MAG: pyridoxamine 5'-phosphate oxidase [Spirulinaceae cyanobacterium SM2_1_0]|nr:pyridoxamine 5'-phosphate oxidase [Spirulinaceae cyanobacterium SM2_1_0]